MFHLGLVDIILAEREREIEAAMRRRRLLKPDDGAADVPTTARPAGTGRALAARARPTAG
jgi:hypothetical protein